MYVISAIGKIIFIDVKKFRNDEEFHSYIWKIMYNIEFAKRMQNIQNLL